MQTLRRIANVSVQDAADMELEPEVSPEGFLRCSINATRAGIFIYADDLGHPIRALRPESAVFDAVSMVTLAGKPITRTHPAQLLSAETATRHTVGATGDTPARVGDLLRIVGTIFDGDTISDIRANGRKQVSCGYVADIIDAPGVDPKFGPYDVIQENIRYNHLAVDIDEGRGGPEVRMLMDSADLSCTQKEAAVAEKKDDDKLVPIKLGDDEHKVTPALAEAFKHHVEGMKSDHEKAQDEMAEKLTKLKSYQKTAEDDEGDLEELGEGEAESEDDDDKAAAKMDSLTLRTEKGRKVKARISKLLGRIAGLKAEVKAKMDSASPAKLAEAARAQAKLVATVMALDSKANASELFKLDALDLKKKAILSRDPKAVLDSKSADYIDGCFQTLAAQVQPSATGALLGAALLMDEKGDKGTPSEVTKTAKQPWTPKPLSAHKASANK